MTTHHADASFSTGKLLRDTAAAEYSFVEFKEFEKVAQTYQGTQLAGIRHASQSATLSAAHKHLGLERIKQLLPAAGAEITISKELYERARQSLD